MRDHRQYFCRSARLCWADYIKRSDRCKFFASANFVEKLDFAGNYCSDKRPVCGARSAAEAAHRRLEKNADFLLLVFYLLFAAEARAQMFGDGPSSSGFGFLFGDPPPAVEKRRPRIIIRSRKPKPKPQAASISGGVFCVRTCDGFYFRIQAGRSSTESETHNGICRAMCPGSPTTLYSPRSGYDIENAVDSKGNSYSKLSNALRFRKEIVPACSCQTEPGDGLADLSITKDATLKKGDMIVSKGGVRTFKGSDGFPYRDADFSKPQNIRSIK